MREDATNLEYLTLKMEIDGEKDVATREKRRPRRKNRKILFVLPRGGPYLLERYSLYVSFLYKSLPIFKFTFLLNIKNMQEIHLPFPFEEITNHRSLIE